MEEQEREGKRAGAGDFSWGGLLGQLSLGRALLEGWAGISGAEETSPRLYPHKGLIIWHAAVGRSRVWLGREQG